MVKETNIPAPGNLEIIRKLLNTWKIPNDSRKIMDKLINKDDVNEFQKENFENIDNYPLFNYTDLINLRNDLRKSISSSDGDEIINYWLIKYPINVELVKNEDNSNYSVSFSPKKFFCSWILAVVLESISNGEWNRLKECPDCKLVFFDHSRNKSKVWCGMYALSDEGRACGSISKVKRYREKQKKMNKNKSK